MLTPPWDIKIICMCIVVLHMFNELFSIYVIYINNSSNILTHAVYNATRTRHEYTTSKHTPRVHTTSTHNEYAVHVTSTNTSRAHTTSTSTRVHTTSMSTPRETSVHHEHITSSTPRACAHIAHHEHITRTPGAQAAHHKHTTNTPRTHTASRAHHVRARAHVTSTHHEHKHVTYERRGREASFRIVVACKKQTRQQQSKTRT